MSRSRPDSARQTSPSTLDGARLPIALSVAAPGPQAPPVVPISISNVSFDSHCLYVRLKPAQEIALPLHRLPVLAAASAAHRRSWQIIDQGTALAWPELNLMIMLSALQHARHDPTCVCEQRMLLEAVR